MCEQKGKIGPFLYIEGTVVCDAVEPKALSPVGNLVKWASVPDFWNILYKSNRDYLGKNDTHFLRGEVVYNRLSKVFEMRIHPALNRLEMLRRIEAAYGLTGLPVKVVESEDFPWNPEQE